MTAAITETQLENAALDATTLANVVNGAAGTSFVSRLGVSLLSLASLTLGSTYLTKLGSETFTNKRGLFGGTTFVRVDSPWEAHGTSGVPPVVALKDVTPNASQSFPGDFGYSIYGLDKLDVTRQLGSLHFGWIDNDTSSASDFTKGFSYVGLHANAYTGGAAATPSFIGSVYNGVILNPPGIAYASYFPGNGKVKNFGDFLGTGFKAGATASNGALISGATSNPADTTAIFRADFQAVGVGQQYVSAATSGTSIAVEFYQNGTKNGSITITNSATNFLTTSDYRLKDISGPQNVEETLQSVLKLPVHRGSLKADETKTVRPLLLAHEVQIIAPHAVHGEMDGKEMQNVDYSKFMSPEAVACFQAMANRLGELETKLAAVQRGAGQ